MVVTLQLLLVAGVERNPGPPAANRQSRSRAIVDSTRRLLRTGGEEGLAIAYRQESNVTDHRLPSTTRLSVRSSTSSHP